MKAKIFTLFILGILFSSISLCRAQNILNDGNFSTTTVINSYFDQPAPDNVWYAWQNSGINNNVAVVDGVCKYDVVTLGAQKNTYDIQLAQTGFPLIQGHSYRLSFDVKADANRTFGLFLGENGGNWTSLIGYDKYTQFATTDWKTITIDFVATSVFYNHKLSFELGAEQVVTYFDNVMLVDIPNVWLTGSAFGGWVESGMIKLSTTDGVTYTATNIEILGDGGGTSEFKFTEGTWPTAAGPLGGPPGFPSGIASVTDGGSPNMQGVPGSWNVTYNYLTKAYLFTPGINPHRAVSFEGTAFPTGAILSTADGIKFSRESLTLGAGTGQFVEKPSDITPSPTANWSSIDFPIGTGTQDGTLIGVAAGTYNTNFNIATGAYNFQPTIVSIIGEFSSWVGDVDMTTTDNITWTLSDIVFTSGGFLKFRDNHNWNYNYGSATGTEFPTGTGISISPYDIPYEAGTYDITFNRTTLAYTFKCLNNCPIHIGIIGSAVPPNYNSGPDVNMFTNDNTTFILPDYTFVTGKAKFRQEDSWDKNWGNKTFPSGVAKKDGHTIPVKAGTYNVTFNIKTRVYNFKAPSSIGIIGSALYGLNFDVDMQSTDGITYTLKNFPFKEGSARFRQDNSWDLSWGNWSFPSGTAYLYGSDIYIQAGTYNVSFNKLTGEYSFTATSCPIAGIQCPTSIYAYSDPGMCGAIVNYPDVVAAPNCGGKKIKIKQTSGLKSGSFFPTGYTINTFLLTNADGNTANCSFTVSVSGDFEPPVISGIEDHLEPLWPPNHKMVPIHLDYKTSDNCSKKITNELYIYSNEPDSGLGNGDLANDWKIKDPHNILLRAERSDTGTGRIYYIYIISHDNSNNYSSQIVTVTVPLGKKKKEHEENIENHKNSVLIIDKSVENVPFTTTVWPNPSTNSFNLEVQSTSDEKVMLTVFDLNGRLLSNLDANSNQTTTFGKDLKAGTYLVLVRQGNNSNTIKVVKQ